ncbi:hypothetical protein CIB84_014026, partial [Bambusicola thoracicus]
LENQRLSNMISRLFTCVLALLHFCLSSGIYRPETLPDIGDAEFIEECVRTHNRFRSGVSPPASNMLYMCCKDTGLGCDLSQEEFVVEKAVKYIIKSIRKVEVLELKRA